jgi:hypothetical protein
MRLPNRTDLARYTNTIHLTIQTPSFVQPSVTLGELIIKTRKATQDPGLLISMQQKTLNRMFNFLEVPWGAEYKFTALDSRSTVIAFHPRGTPNPSRGDFSNTITHYWVANSITIIECPPSNQNQAQQIRIVTRVRE